MSRDEETDEPITDEPITGDDHTPAGEPVDFGKPESAEGASAQAPRFTVVVSGDGSAAIDGVPVSAEDGESTDAAVLDALHHHARDNGTPVTAAIKDPSAGYVAYVEVAPDGSSRLLEQHEGPRLEDFEEPRPRGFEPSGRVGAPPSPGEDPAADVEESGQESGDEYAEGVEYTDDPDAPHERTHVPDTPHDLYKHDDLDDPDRFDGFESQDDGFRGFPVEEEDEASYALPEPTGSPFAPSAAFSGTGPQPDERLEGGLDESLGEESYDERDHEREDELHAGPGPAMGPGSDSGPRIPRRNAVRQSDDEYESRGLLNRPLVVGPVALLVAAAVIIPLVILGSGGSSGGHQKQTARSSDETYAATPSVPPTGFASPPVHSPLPSPVETTASPKAKPKAKVEPKVTPAGVTVTVTAQPPRVTTTVIASPPLETAADAVNRLARRDPSGRHICYRAYVSGTGWQDPVCDGTIAGTTGRNLPIKAINIASYGVGGSAANAFLHDPKSTNGQGHWQPSWTAIKGNGQNLYIGSTKRNAPAVLGFAINVGNGQVCQVARLHNYNWGQQFCTKPRPDFTFGGTLDNNVWLEAVKFTV